MEKVGEHVGGYDEWTVDITDAAARASTNSFFHGATPVAVLCDNSRDAEMIPSDLSDFCRYGGLYRHVNLVYVPAISLAQVHITPKLAADGTVAGTLQLLGRRPDHDPVALGHRQAEEFIPYRTSHQIHLHAPHVN